MSPLARLPTRLCVGWGMGTLGMALMFNATSLLLLRYLVDHLGMAAALAGTIIGLAKFYDAVTDPLMGIISDRTRSRWGRRRPYLLLGGIVSAVSFVLLFNLNWFQGTSLLVGAAVFALLLNATGYTIFNVPYMAMPPEMTPHYHERTRLMSYRVAAVGIGQLIASFVGPLIIGAFGGAILGHQVMGLVLGVTIGAASAIAFFMTADAPSVATAQRSTHSFREQVTAALENKPFLILLGVKTAHLLGLAVFIAVLPFMFGHVLGVSYNYLGLYFLAQASLVFLFQPVWVQISGRFGKKTVFYAGVAVYSLMHLSWLWAAPGEPAWAIVLRGVIGGIGAGALLLAGQALLPDTMEYDYQRTGLRREGVLAGFYTTVEKVSFALGPALTGVILGAAGYIPSPVDGQTQPESAQQAIYFCTALLPVLALLLAALLLSRYNLTEERLKGGRGVAD